MPNISLNNNACKIIMEKVLPQWEALNIKYYRLTNGTTVIDMGVHAVGSWTAGKFFTDISLGGLGELSFGKFQLKEYLVPLAEIKVSYPSIAELAGNVTYWKFVYKNKNMVISGPIRSINGTDIFAQSVKYRDVYAKAAVACI